MVDRNTLVLGVGGIVAAWAITRALDQLVATSDELAQSQPSRSSRSRRRR